MNTDAGTDTQRGLITEQGDGNIKAPKNIVYNATYARSLHEVLRKDHIKRCIVYASIEGLLAGNPPYDPAMLAKNKLSHITNFNGLDARATYEKQGLSYWNLINESEYVAKFTIPVDDPEARKYEDIIAKYFNKMIRKWPSYTTAMSTLSALLVKTGISAAIWPDERDWRWRVVEPSRLFLPDQTQTDIEQLTYFTMETDVTAQYLFEVYEQYKDAPKGSSPWDCDAVSELLMRLANSSVKLGDDITNPMELQKSIQNGDMSYNDLFSDSIRLVSLLYKEYDGKWSHYMFDRTEGEFLYFADRQYEKINDCIVIFTVSPGEVTIHSNRGLGHKLFSASQAVMQLDCSLVDAARWASTPLVKGVATGSKDVEAIRFYPGVITNIGTAEFVQNNLGANIDQLVGVSQYLTGKIQINAANSGDDPSMPDKDKGSKSAPEFRFKAYKEHGIQKNCIAHFYSQLDTVFQTTVMKLLNSKKGYPGYEWAKWWIDSCIKEGVPEEVFSTANLTPWGMPEMLECKASRVAGEGSTAARLMGLEALSPMVPTFGPKAQAEYSRQLVIATMGPEYVTAFTADKGTPDEMAGGASLASVENSVMQLGKSAVVSPDNEHKSHLSQHIALGINTIQMIQQQAMSAIEADKVFTQLVPHMQEHAQIAAQSPFAQQFMQQIKQALTQIFQYATLNKKNAERMLQAELRQRAEAQANQERVMSEEELKNMQAMNDEARKDRKVEAQVQRAAEANRTRGQVMMSKVREDAALERERMQLEHQNNVARVVNDGIAEQKRIDQEGTLELRRQLQEMNGNTPSPTDIE